jgi:hypothetical protein
MSHRTGIGSVGGKREGLGRTTMDKRPAPPRAVSLFLPLLTFMIPDDGDCRWRPEAGDRRMSRRTNGLSSAKNFEEAHSDGGLRHTRLNSAIPRDHPAELARNGPVSMGENRDPGPTPRSRPRVESPSPQNACWRRFPRRVL